MRVEGKALVTGASRGMGRAVAFELARRGFEVVAGVRDTQGSAALLEEARETSLKLEIEELDVTRPATIRIPDGLRILVNNAGIEGLHLPVEHAPLSMWREIFETNLFGLVEVTQRAIPALRASGGGVICNITSCSILAPMPFFAAYRASKAAVGALGESLRTELAAFGIRILEIQPGAIATDMLANSEREPEAIDREGYRELAERVFEVRKGTSGQVTASEQAARSIVDAILDDGAPLRCACDPMGAGLLEAWRQGTDEQMMSGMLQLFAPHLAG